MVELLAEKFPDATTEELSSILAGLDMEAVKRVNRERFALSLWEGEAINGCEYNEMIDLGMPFGGGESFVIRDKQRGRVVYFQTFDPDSEGYQPMDETRAMEAGRAVVERLASSAEFAALVNYVSENLS